MANSKVSLAPVWVILVSFAGMFVAHFAGYPGVALALLAICLLACLWAAVTGTGRGGSGDGGVYGTGGSSDSGGGGGDGGAGGGGGE